MQFSSASYLILEDYDDLKPEGKLTPGHSAVGLKLIRSSETMLPHDQYMLVFGRVAHRYMTNGTEFIRLLQPTGREISLPAHSVKAIHEDDMDKGLGIAE